jgi:hypothetical protein
MTAAVRYLIPSSLIWKQPDDAVLLMQLGALANAMLAVASTSVSSLATGVGRVRDRFQSNLLMISYLKEACDAIDNKRAWDLIQRGLDAGFKLPKPIADYRRVFSRGKDSLYHRFVLETRNTKGFHVDKEHFDEWAKQHQGPEVVLLRRDSGAPVDRAFTAAMEFNRRSASKWTISARTRSTMSCNCLHWWKGSLWGFLSNTGSIQGRACAQ